MSDQWDPKYPRTSEIWSESYDKADSAIQNEPRWQAAFAAVVDAYRGGQLTAMGNIYWQPTDRNDRRRALWDYIRDQIFVHPPEAMPPYAQAIWDAVPLSWTEKGGLEDEAIRDWTVRRIVALKTTALFIAGLFEERLSPSLAGQRRNAEPSTRPNAGRRLFIELA